MELDMPIRKCVCVCMCVCEREKERERERDCVCVCVRSYLDAFDRMGVKLLRMDYGQKLNSQLRRVVLNSFVGSDFSMLTHR